MSNKRFPGLVSGPVAERDRSRNLLWKVRRFVFGGFLLGLLSLAGLLAYSFSSPFDDDISERLQEENIICASGVAECNTENAMAAGATVDEDRELIDDFSEIPQVAVDALVATEDQGFYGHRGVNAVGLVRAAGRTVISKATGQGVAQGGSSITQQYVKNTYIKPETSTLKRKLIEPSYAMKLESRLKNEVQSNCTSGDTNRCVKNEILRRYFNEVYYGKHGRNLYGLKAAADGYFGVKDLGKLTLPEAAYLAGVLRAPAPASPERNPQEARRRIDVSLNLMFEEGYITEAEFDKAKADMDANATPDKYDNVGLPNFIEPKSVSANVKGKEFGTNYFIGEVNQELAELAESGEVRQGGLKVYTTIDLEAQEQAYKAVTNYVKPDNPKMPNAALVTVDNNGLVRAMVGGTNQERQYNFATSGGFQSGSLNKPFGLAVALEQGLSMNSLIAAPSEMVFPKANAGEDWLVNGGIGDFPDDEKPKYGNLREATSRSWNTAYAQLIQREEVGPQKVAAMIELFGIQSVPESQKVPSLILGVNSANPMEMASAYSVFERDGAQIESVVIERIVNDKGQVICWYPSNGKCESKSTEQPQRKTQQIIDSEITRQINGALVDVVKEGTGKNANQIPHAAGKTGTTQDYQAAWFSGFSCDLTTTVMMGYEGKLRMSDAVNETRGNDVPPMRELFGDNATSKGNITSGLPAKMWGDYMKAINKPACNGISVSTNYGGNIIGQELDTKLSVCGVVSAPQPVDPNQPQPGQPQPGQQQPGQPQPGQQQPGQPGQQQPGQPGQQPGQQQQKLEDLVLPDGQVIPADQLRFLSDEQIEALKNGGQLQNSQQVQNISFNGSLFAAQPQNAQPQSCLVYEGNGKWVQSDTASQPAGPAGPATVPPTVTTMPEITIPETTMPETTQDSVPTTKKQKPTTTAQPTTTEKDITTTTNGETSTTKEEEGPIRPTVRGPRNNP